MNPNFSPNLSLSSPESSLPPFSPQAGDQSASRRYLFMCRKKVTALMVRNTKCRSERIKLINRVKTFRAQNRDLREQILTLQEEVQRLNQAIVAAQKTRHSNMRAFSFATNPPVHLKVVVSGLVVTELVGHALGEPKLKPISLICRKTKKVMSSCKRRIFRGKTHTQIEDVHHDLQWILPKNFSVAQEKTRKVITEVERSHPPLPMIYYPFT
jgi:hypothetical protein